MKRKRGKKGNSKNAPDAGTNDDPSIDNLSGEDESGPDDTSKDETNSRMDTETPSSTGTDQPEKPPPVTSTIEKPVGRLVYNRVKVKIKTSKPLEPQITSSDAHTHSDTDKSSQHVGVEKQVVSEKVEDSANSAPENVVSVNQGKKTGSIKIKTSKGFSSSLSQCNNSGGGQSQSQSQPDRMHQKEAALISRESVYNKQELIAALEVIKKIMKMDAAEPFNAPVNPIALGIPDYFDVIKTPMDFGTICNNLEKGLKYMNSEDVYNDVQYIWENCYKYNNKGDYILELMKRVKKNFSKYWSASGLYNENDIKDGNISSHGKSKSSKHKSRKRHGVKRHKDDCMCAICIMMRKRLEREQILNPGNDQMETSDGLTPVKVEGASMVGSFNGDDTSSSTENSQNQEADADMEEVKMENTIHNNQQEDKEKDITSLKNNENAIAEQSKSGTEKNEDTDMADVSDAIKDSDNNEEKVIQNEDDTSAVENQKPKELSNAGEKAKLYENLRQRYENPMVLELCKTLFPENLKSLWSKKLVQKKGKSGSSKIGDAIATFIKFKA